MTALLEDTSNETFDKWSTLNTAVAPSKLDKSHTPRAINVWPDERPGSIVTVEGWLQIGTLPSGNPCRFLYTFTKSDGTSIVLCSDNGTVYKTADFITFTSIITGLASSFQLRAVTLRDKVWLTNGNDAVRTYDGTTVVVLDGSGGTTPNVPKGKFIAVFHERIWIGDIPSGRSSTRFTALVDASGNDIAPDNTAAWPTSNEIEYGEDDGDVICGFKVFLTVLHVFKGETIYRLDGQDEYTYTPTRTTATTGCRIQESIQERDNLLEFIGRDGVYEFNGAVTTKVSDPIESVDLTQFSFSNIQQSTSQQKLKLWSSSADFNAGTLTAVTSSRVPDSVIVDHFTYDGSIVPASDLTNPWTKTVFRSATESCTSGILNLTTTTGAPAGQNTSAVQYSRTESGISGTLGVRMGIYAKMTSSNSADHLDIYVDDGVQRHHIEIYPTHVDLCNAFSGALVSTTMNTTSAYHLYEIVQIGTAITVYIDGVSSMTWTSVFAQNTGTKLILFALSCAGVSLTASCAIDYVTVIFFVSGTAQIISDVYHITDTISSWGAFQANYANNGGTLTFYMRSGTSSGACTGASWTAITPGATIAFSLSNVFVQWRADFTVSGTNSPELDDVTVNWNTGSTSTVTTQGVATIVFKNRYLLAGALTGSTTNNLLIARGKRIYGTPWIRLGQFNILAFCIFNNTLYAAAADSAGLLKLDIGNSANGAALDSYWETRDEVGNADEIFNKRWPVIIVTGQRKGNYNLNVDVSLDSGVTYNSRYAKTISLSGTGRFQQELRYPDLRSKQIRVRVRTNGIDQPFEVESIKVFWRKSYLR